MFASLHAHERAGDTIHISASVFLTSPLINKWQEFAVQQCANKGSEEEEDY